MPTQASGETRTISLRHMHTGEKLTITYKKDGRYIPSAMAQINHLLRDWRRNETITIDPRTIDLVWELHADLGSQVPVNIVCGYRSPATNAFLHRIGRHVATKSQHMKGKAIDFFFPDVPLTKIRNSALVRRVGGVGYYSGKNGFVHLDSGNVRHWGPGMAPSQMASNLRDGMRYVGARMKNKTRDMAPVDAGVAVASADSVSDAQANKPGSLWGLVKSLNGNEQVAPVQKVPVEAAYEGDDDELAQWSQDAADVGNQAVSAPAPLDQAISAAAPAAPAKVKPVAPDSQGMASMAQTAAVESLADGQDVAAADEQAQPALAKIIKPQLKPASLKSQAVADASAAEAVTIMPASAPPESQSLQRKPSRVAKPAAVAALGDARALLDQNISEEPAIIASSVEPSDDELISYSEGKTAFAEGLRSNPESSFTEDAISIQPVVASAAGDVSWWKRLFSSADELKRNNGVSQDVGTDLAAVLPQSAVLGPDGSGVIGYKPLQTADGKSDMLVVNRQGKGNLPDMKLRLSSAESLQNSTGTE